MVIPDMLMMLLLHLMSGVPLNILPSIPQGIEIPGTILDMPRSTRIR